VPDSVSRPHGRTPSKNRNGADGFAGFAGCGELCDEVGDKAGYQTPLATLIGLVTER
jgi:hypothetical protein